MTKVRNYYQSSGGRPQPGVVGRILAFVDRIDGKRLVYGIIALDVAIFLLFQVSQGVSHALRDFDA